MNESALGAGSEKSRDLIAHCDKLKKKRERLRETAEALDGEIAKCEAAIELAAVNNVQALAKPLVEKMKESGHNIGTLANAKSLTDLLQQIGNGALVSNERRGRGRPAGSKKKDRALESASA